MHGTIKHPCLLIIMNEEALHFVERSLEIDPNNAAALATKGFIFYNLNQYEKALEYCDKALKLEPNDAEIWNHKGFALDKLGRGNEAQNCFNKAKQLGLNK